MRDLTALLSTRAGRLLLEQEHVFHEPATFVRHLRPPRALSEVEAVQYADDLPVYTHQQVYLDYRNSVVAKITTLRELQRRSSRIKPEFVWIDTDRAGSDKLSLRLYLKASRGRVPIRLAPNGCERLEPRFIKLDPARLHAATGRMKALIQHHPSGSGPALERLERLRPLLESNGTLTDLSRGLTDFLLAETLSFRPRPIIVSDQIAAGALRPALEAILNRQQDFVAAFNKRIQELRSLDVAPQLKPLPADYLPLFMACPVDGRRLRLRLQRNGKDCFANALDSSGRQHSYELGREVLTMDALDRNARWGPDVTLPILLNDHYSGMVAGKSSGLYMLVLREVMLKAMDKAPLPVLVPASWEVFPPPVDSLLNAYLHGLAI